MYSSGKDQQQNKANSLAMKYWKTGYNYKTKTPISYQRGWKMKSINSHMASIKVILNYAIHRVNEI